MGQMVKDSTSRYRNTRLMLQSTVAGERVVYYQSREAISYKSDSENQVYVVRAGDTLQTLALKFFSGFADASNLWWVIAEFQPEPIFDPTLRLEPGSLLIIPSVTMVSYLLNSAPLATVI
jgi:nucleoid-associated protein YgaU